MKRTNHHNAEKNPNLEVIIETPRGSRNKYKYEPGNKM